METTSDLLQKLKLSTNLSEEVVDLETLQSDLKPKLNHQQRHDDPDEEWLSMAVENLGDDDDDEVVNPFPKMTPYQLFNSQDDLNQFTCYVFMRRFGWSEGINGETVQDERRVAIHQKGKLAMEKEAHFKARLNELLDEFIKWYLSQPVSQPLLQSLRHTFKEAINKPVVRNQTVVHVMEWLRHRIVDRGAHQHIEEVYQLILCGLTDIWSAIRNAAVSRLSHVIDGFSLTELQVFFMSLAQICQSKESTWQSKEGALMAITGILKRFQWTGKLATTSLCDLSGGDQFILKFGKQELSQLPEFLTSHMHTIVYPLLAHRQLSIRENATKAFSAFLSRCEVKEALTSFTEAVTRLRHGTDISLDQSSLPHLAVLRKDYRFLNAYEAEGLLGVCVYLIKHISPGFLLPMWPEYFSVFNLYLMHPASTVRQATSAVFKYLVAKDSNNPSMLKLVLQALCADWDMNLDLLTRDTTSRSTIYSSDLHSNGSESNLMSRSQATDAAKSTTGSEMELRQQRKRHLSGGGGGKYCSVTSLCALDDESTDSLFSKAWEWREGRLLAYELIVKFLIINHIHYLFPSYALPPSKFDGTVSTDDSLTPSHQSRMVPSRKPVQKSLSHGGTSLRQMMSSQGALRKTMSQDEALVEEDERAKKERSGSEDLEGTTLKVDEFTQKSLRRSGSDRRKKSIGERRSRTLAEGHMYDKPIPKHYSYYANSNHSNQSKKQNCIAASLLEQASYMDRDTQKLFTICDSNHNLRVRSVINKCPLHDMNAPPQDVAALLNAIKALQKKSSGCSQSPNWLQYLDLDSMSNILCAMLLQTIGCLGDTRWELRRMGHQALPLITECIRWYDMVILTTLWDKYFTPEASLASYGCALSLRFSIHHATKLDHFLQQPPASWKDPESCQRISLSIVDAIRGGIQRWCGVAKQLVQRPIIDKLSVVALEILMLANSFFPQLVSEKAVYERIVLECFQHIFRHAYPHHSTYKPSKGQDQLRAFQTLTNGCLNCCLKPASVSPYPQQVEAKLLAEIHSLIPVFIKSCKVDSAAALLPILVHHVKVYCADETIVRSMLDGGASIVQSLLEESMCRSSKVKDAGSVVDNIQLTFQEITLVLQDKTLEPSTVRQVLDMFLNLSQLTEGTEHLQLVFGAVSQRLELNGSISSQFGMKDSGEAGDSVFGSSHLAFRSNDIPASPVDDLRISDEDEDDREHAAHNHMLSESVALNTSSSSSNTARLSVSGGEKELRALTPTAATDDEDDCGSDWDSWDEEEEDQSMTCSLFAEFMKKLKAQYSQVEHPGGPSPFQVELSNARDHDRKLISSLLI